jgi:indole-3-glycerol phosphate synthase
VDRYYPGIRPPLLRKDFLFDPYQVYEARAAGADAILLIAAILADGPLTELLALARAGPRCPGRSARQTELERVLATDAEVVGVNNRDLLTFV